MRRADAENRESLETHSAKHSREDIRTAFPTVQPTFSLTIYQCIESVHIIMIVKRTDLSLSVEVKECGLKRSLKCLSDEIRFPRQRFIRFISYTEEL